MPHPALLSLALGTLGVVAGQLPPSEELWIEPAVPLVELGGSVRVTLRGRCGPSDPSGSPFGSPPGLETSLRKIVVSEKPGETVLDLVNVTEWSSSPFIFHTCTKRRKKEIRIVVYSIPAPQMTPSRPDTWNLSCSVSSTALPGNVTVTLRSDGTILATGTGQGSGQSQPDTVQLTHSMPARLGDNGKNVTCEALLDVSPNEPPVNVTSEQLVLDLTALPRGPLLDAPKYGVTGDPFDVTCTVRPDVPAGDFTVTADGRSFPVTASPDGHRVTAEVALERPGRASLGCSVRVDGVEERTERNVHIYHVPKPRINVTSATPVVAGTVLTGTCALPPGAAGDIQLRVRSGDSVLRDWGPSPLSFDLAVPEEGGELELSCDARLENLGRAAKTSSVRVPVHAKPRLDESSCPRRQNWTEGQQGVLRCRARGWPEPQVECSRDGGSVTPGIAYPAHRSHAGIYVCRASNALGTDQRNVTLDVQYHDPVPLLPVLLGVLLPALVLLGAAAAFILYHRNTKIGEYWLWKRRQPPPADVTPLRPAGPAGTEPAPNGAGPGAP